MPRLVTASAELRQSKMSTSRSLRNERGHLGTGSARGFSDFGRCRQAYRAACVQVLDFRQGTVLPVLPSDGHFRKAPIRPGIWTGLGNRSRAMCCSAWRSFRSGWACYSRICAGPDPRAELTSVDAYRTWSGGTGIAASRCCLRIGKRPGEDYNKFVDVLVRRRANLPEVWGSKSRPNEQLIPGHPMGRTEPRPRAGHRRSWARQWTGTSHSVGP
jgi:hypothetical protein